MEDGGGLAQLGGGVTRLEVGHGARSLVAQEVGIGARRDRSGRPHRRRAGAAVSSAGAGEARGGGDLAGRREAAS